MQCSNAVLSLTNQLLELERRGPPANGQLVAVSQLIPAWEAEVAKGRLRVVGPNELAQQLGIPSG